MDEERARARGGESARRKRRRRRRERGGVSHTSEYINIIPQGVYDEYNIINTQNLLPQMVEYII